MAALSPFQIPPLSSEEPSAEPEHADNTSPRATRSARLLMPDPALNAVSRALAPPARACSRWPATRPLSTAPSTCSKPEGAGAARPTAATMAELRLSHEQRTTEGGANMPELQGKLRARPEVGEFEGPEPLRSRAHGTVWLTSQRSAARIRFTYVHEPYACPSAAREDRCRRASYHRSFSETRLALSVGVATGVQLHRCKREARTEGHVSFNGLVTLLPVPGSPNTAFSFRRRASESGGMRVFSAVVPTPAVRGPQTLPSSVERNRRLVKA